MCVAIGSFIFFFLRGGVEGWWTMLPVQLSLRIMRRANYVMIKLGRKLLPRENNERRTRLAIDGAWFHGTWFCQTGENRWFAYLVKFETWAGTVMCCPWRMPPVFRHGNAPIRDLEAACMFVFEMREAWS